MVIERYKYCFQRKKKQNDRIAWPCTKYWSRNCKAAVLTKGGRVIQKSQGKYIFLFFVAHFKDSIASTAQPRLVSIRPLFISIYVAEPTYPADDSELCEARLKNALKERARSEPHAPTPEVYSKQIVGLVGQVSKNFVSPVWYTRILSGDKPIIKSSYAVSVFFFFCFLG